MFRKPGIAPLHAASVSEEIAQAPRPSEGRVICFALWRRKAWILSGMLVALPFASIFLLLVTPRYLAMSQLLINPNDLHVIDNAVTSNKQNDSDSAQVETQARVITSDIVLGRVVDTLGLERDPEFTRPAMSFDTLVERAGVKDSVTKTDPATEALLNLKLQVAARRQERTYVVDVTATAKRPEQSIAIVRAMVAAYLEDQATSRAEAAHRATEQLSSRLEELKASVREAEQRVEAFRAQNDVVEANGQVVTEQQFAEINNQLIRARARTAEAKAIQDRLHSAADDKSLYVPARGDYDRALANQQSLESSLESLKSEEVTRSKAIVRLRELQRDVEASRAVYESFLVRARETGEQQGINTTDIREITQASLTRKVWPPSALWVIATALVLGGVLGGGLALACHVAQELSEAGLTTVLCNTPTQVKPREVDPRVEIIPYIRGATGKTSRSTGRATLKGSRKAPPGGDNDRQGNRAGAAGRA
jgi:succinoglycan biosynthesis transport protein ExoP